MCLLKQISFTALESFQRNIVAAAEIPDDLQLIISNFIKSHNDRVKLSFGINHIQISRSTQDIKSVNIEIIQRFIIIHDADDPGSGFGIAQTAELAGNVDTAPQTAASQAISLK